MVQSVTVFDEEWTEDDMRDHLGWQHERSLICECGFPQDETTAPGRDDAYDAEVVACHACATRDRVVRAFQDRRGDMAGIRTRVWERD